MYDVIRTLKQLLLVLFSRRLYIEILLPVHSLYVSGSPCFWLTSLMSHHLLPVLSSVFSLMSWGAAEHLTKHTTSPFCTHSAYTYIHIHLRICIYMFVCEYNILFWNHNFCLQQGISSIFNTNLEVWFFLYSAFSLFECWIFFFPILPNANKYVIQSETSVMSNIHVMCESHTAAFSFQTLHTSGTLISSWLLPVGSNVFLVFRKCLT